MEWQRVIYVWYRGRGVTGDTVLNVMHGIIDAKDKKAESIEKKCKSIAATKVAEIANQITLGRATVEKLEAIENNDNRVEAVGNITKPIIDAMLVM